MSKKDKQEHKMDLPFVGKEMRIVLGTGRGFAGIVLQEWDDFILIEKQNGETGLIRRAVITEIWEGVGAEKKEEKKEEVKQ